MTSRPTGRLLAVLLGLALPMAMAGSVRGSPHLHRAGVASWGRRLDTGAASRGAVESTMRLRGGVMWVGGGRQFNRTMDPNALPEAAEDTFHPLRERQACASRIKNLMKKTGSRMRTNEVISLEEESKYMIRAQSLLRTKSLSVELTAAQNFQKYVVGDLAFSQQRVGIMYGRVDDEGNAFCDVIYEPPQDGDAECYNVQDDPDAALVDRVAAMLGLRRVGWVFTARPRKCILSGGDIKASCEMQQKLEDENGFDFARSWVSAVITRNETTGIVVFEAYQVSDLAMDMHRKGILKAPAGANKGYTRTTENVLVERKDSMKVDTDFFLNTVPLKTHTSPLFGGREGEFPIENRPGTAQSGFEVKHILKCHEELSFSSQLRDFHMLIFIAKLMDPVTDLPALCKAVVSGEEPLAGHVQMIKALAEQK